MRSHPKAVDMSKFRMKGPARPPDYMPLRWPDVRHKALRLMPEHGCFCLRAQSAE